MKKINKLRFSLVFALVLLGGFVEYQIAQAVVGEGTATIDGGASGGNVTVVKATSHVFTVVLTVGASGITADAENPTFTIPAGFTAPDASPVANAGLVVADGDWFVAGGATCVIDSPAVGLTAAVGQVITVDVTTACTVGPGGNITLTYKGQSASAMGATALNIGTNDVISYVAVTPIAAPPTITVTETSATLNVIKQVVNDNGGTAVAGAWTMTVTSSNGGSGTGNAVGSESGTVYTLQTDKQYSVAESGGPSGYSASSSSNCTIASAVAGTAYTCTITNNDTAPALHLRKTVTNDNAGAALNTAWTLTATGAAGSPTNLTGTTPVDSGATFKADAYTLAESGGPAGYTAGSWVCVGGAQVGAVVTLALGESATCTINNNDNAPSVATLHVVKTVINDNGGTSVASDFTIDVAGTNVSDPSFAGSAAGVDVTLDAGSYAVTETSLSGYLQSGSGDCSGTIAAGETKTCTITNNDIAPQLIVNKIVINNNGGVKVIADFPLFINGSSVVSGVASTTATGLHTVSETTDSGYTSTIGGNCAADGTITLALGDVKTCTITNDDIPPVSSERGGPIYTQLPPLIDVVKVPNPLALPAGPGTVTYTYTIRNIGTVTMSDITIAGDSCSPINFISGDSNSNGRLELSETWVYQCSATLSQTHTNIVTATGWANGISATDIANATVIVGIPLAPPLIHVTKVPSPLALPEAGGAVTYTYTVTNPGTAPLSNVSIADDKCTGLPGRVAGHPGDLNQNNLLESNEAWSFTCESNLTQTTTNTGTASGSAHGLIATDFAIATVVVSPLVPQLSDTGVAAIVPRLPDTGLPPGENNFPWNVIVSAGIFVILTVCYFARRKQTV